MCSAALQMLGLQRCVFSAANDKFGGTGIVSSICKCGGGLDVGTSNCPEWHFDCEQLREKRQTSLVTRHP
jgi:tRNA(Arg) A34 adenosine deaminase TadA